MKCYLVSYEINHFNGKEGSLISVDNWALDNFKSGFVTVGDKLAPFRLKEAQKL